MFGRKRGLLYPEPDLYIGAIGSFHRNQFQESHLLHYRATQHLIFYGKMGSALCKTYESNDSLSTTSEDEVKPERRPHHSSGSCHSKSTTASTSKYRSTPSKWLAKKPKRKTQQQAFCEDPVAWEIQEESNMRHR